MKEKIIKMESIKFKQHKGKKGVIISKFEKPVVFQKGDTAVLNMRISDGDIEMESIEIKREITDAFPEPQEKGEL